MSYFKYYEALEGLDSFDLLLISFCYIDKNFHFKEKEYLIEQGISNDVIKKVEKTFFMDTLDYSREKVSH